MNNEPEPKANREHALAGVAITEDWFRRLILRLDGAKTDDESPIAVVFKPKKETSQ